MSDSMPYADIIILALIAGFILLRLRGVLGQKIGNDSPAGLRPPEPKEEEAARMVTEKARQKQEEEKKKDDALVSALSSVSVQAGIRDIKAADASFTLQNFLKGARGAFEMLFDAFNKGDKQTMQMLLSPALYENFAAEYDRMQKEGKRVETTLVAIESDEVVRASLEKNVARVAVRFISEQVRLTRGPDGEIIEGNAADTERVEDEWTFERVVDSRNPNWKIIET